VLISISSIVWIYVRGVIMQIPACQCPLNIAVLSSLSHYLSVNPLYPDNFVTLQALVVNLAEVLRIVGHS
jgi:hypothetical protein